MRPKLFAVAALAVLSLRAQPAAMTLDQCVQEAIGDNLDLAAERWNVSIAQSREITARLRPNPILTVSGQTLDLLGAGFAADKPLGPNQFNLHTDFVIERARKREQRIQLARQQSEQAGLAVREMMRQVVFAVQNAFVDVLQARSSLALAQENLKSLDGVVAINQSRLGSGDLSQVEFERSRLAALQFRAAVEQARLQLDQARTKLQLLMGRKTIDAGFDVSGELRRDTVAEQPAEILRRALVRRPDYLATVQAQSLSRADLRLQVANARADVVVGAEYTRQSAWGLSGNSLGVSLSIPLAVFNRNQGEIARAQRELGRNAARSLALETAMKAEVDQAYRQYTVSRQILSTVETDMLARARSVRDTTDYSYRRGEASLVELLDAQRAFNDAMQTFNEARASYARSLYLIDSVSAATIAGS